jgi:GNAT superfamily N-acetyltransferase
LFQNYSIAHLSSSNLISYQALAQPGGALRISLAGPKDLPQVLDLIQAVIKDMTSRGNEQWNDEYPTREIFENDIKCQQLYTMTESGRILGIMVITHEQEPQYDPVPWKEKKGKYVVGHRIAVLPGQHRKGIADKFMEFFLKYAQENGCTSIRLDTYHKNDRSQALMEKYGFKRLPGHINFRECTGPFYCYELVFEKKKK